MKIILLLSLLATSGFSQTPEWIYYNKGGNTNSVNRIKPDGTENELIMEDAGISDISEDGSKFLFSTNGIILLVDTESMDTLTVDNDGINPRFTSDENVIVYYKYETGNPDADELYKYNGEILAINKFNKKNSNRKIVRDYGTVTDIKFGSHFEQVFIFHIFNHQKYSTNTNSSGNLWDGINDLSL